MKSKIPLLLAMLGCVPSCWGQVPTLESAAPPPTAISFPFLLYRANPANSSLFSQPMLHLHFHRGFGGLHTYQFYAQKPTPSAHFFHAGLSRNGDALLHISRIQVGWAKKLGNTSLGLRTHYLQMNGPDIRGVSQVQLEVGTNTSLSEKLQLASLISALQMQQTILLQARIGLQFQPIPVLYLTSDMEYSPIHFAFQTTLFYRFRPQYIGSFGYYSRLSQFHLSLTQEATKQLQATLSLQKSAERPLQSQFSLTYLFPKL